MNASRLAYITIVVLAALAAVNQADAQTVATHPALSRTAVAPAVTIDPNRFLVGHPAGGLPRALHANHDHPAVTVYERGAPALDTDHFLVQPPSPVRWADASAQPVQPLQMAVAR